MSFASLLAKAQSANLANVAICIPYWIPCQYQYYMCSKWRHRRRRRCGTSLQTFHQFRRRLSTPAKSLAVTSCCHSLAWVCSPDVNVRVLGSENGCLEDNGVMEAHQEPQALLLYTSEMVNHFPLKDRKKHVGETWENKHGCDQNIVSNWERGSTNQDQLWCQSSSDPLRADLSSAGRTNWCRRGTISCSSSDVFSPAPQLWQKCGDTEGVVVVTDILSHVLTTSETQQ